MQINLLHKLLNFVLNYKFINLNKTYFDHKILQNKLWYISQKHLKFNMEASLPQIIITKRHTKLLVKVGCLFNIQVEIFCSFIKDVLLFSSI